MYKRQEESIKYLIKGIQEGRPEGRTIVEESPVKSSGSNGGVERAVQELEGEIRAIFLGLQERLGRKLDARERIVAFIPEYGAYLMNRLAQGNDGKVPYQRVKGKRPTILGLEFGEKVLYKVKLGGKLEKINPRWEYGIFVGVRKRSNELSVATPEGILQVRSVKRIPVEQRWGNDCVDWVKWAPWHRYREAEDADGDVPEGVPAEERKVGVERESEGTVIIRTRESAPRDFFIQKKDGEKHGFTRGCPGCASWFRGLGRQPHTEACRARFRELLKGEAKLESQEKRRQEFVDREKDRKKRKEEKNCLLYTSPSPRD